MQKLRMTSLTYCSGEIAIAVAGYRLPTAQSHVQITALAGLLRSAILLRSTTGRLTLRGKRMVSSSDTDISNAREEASKKRQRASKSVLGMIGLASCGSLAAMDPHYLHLNYMCISISSCLYDDQIVQNGTRCRVPCIPGQPFRPRVVQVRVYCAAGTDIW